MVDRKLFIDADELEFKQAFVVNFISSWVAAEYNDAIMRGEHDRLSAPPAEDAQMLADDAWDHWLDAIGLIE